MNKILKIFVFVLLHLISIEIFADKIEKIHISGNLRVEKPTIQEYLKLNIGDEYSQAAKNNAIKSLYSTSFFDDVNIEFNSGTLTVTVSETPFVSKVIFRGNNKIKAASLENAIYTSAGESLRKMKLSSDVETIKEMYKKAGRFSARVKATVEKQENNRVQVIFDINEGPKTGIKSINFVGNDNFKDSELKSVIQSKESRWFRFLESNDTYDAERIEFDKYLIKQFYNSVGFADFRVISVTADLLPTKEGFILTYSIEEGKKYRFGEINFVNKITNIDNKEIEKFIKSHKGEVFNANVINRMTDLISGHLSSKGYPQVNITPEFNNDFAKGEVNVNIIVEQAYKIFINKININGNLRTEDQVIRRQMQIAEGDIFSRTKIERGERNIRNLDYFGKLELKVSPTDQDDRYDIDIDVEEKSTSYIGFDMGYNTAGGPFGKISFVERNLNGTGKYLTSGVQVGRKSIYYYLGLTEPSFMDKDLSLGANIFRSENGKGSGFGGNGEQNYSMSSTGLKTTASYNITDDLSHEVEYLIKRDELKNPSMKIQKNNAQKTNELSWYYGTSAFLREQMGKFTTSQIGQSLTYDQTDSRMFPKNGYLLSGTQEFAGIGGDTKFLKHDLSGKLYKSFVENKYTVSFSAAAGHIAGVGGKKVRISDRFNLGDYSLRGFASGGIGPRDIKTDEGLGGQKYYSLSTELAFPLFLPKEFDISGALFIDAGSLWDADTKTSEGFYNKKSLRASAGFGFLWVTRFAPIRVDWGFPFKKEKYDEKQTFHIKFAAHL